MSDQPTSGFQFDLPHKSQTIPAMLEADHRFRFRCYKGISCFNECCKHADVTLAPFDILRLKQHKGLSSEEFLKQYTVPFEMDAHLPGVKLKTTDEGACLFMTEEGCSVYPDRPTACRYYPIGLMNMKKQDEKAEEQHYFMVKEPHCKGHEEDRELTIEEYRQEQGVEPYDDMNHGWYQIVLKKRSTGPTVGAPSETSIQFFFMCSYDVDRFRRFAMSPAFQQTYSLSDAEVQNLQTDDVALLQFGFRLQRQVLFGEKTIDEKSGVAEKRIAERKAVWEARRLAEIEHHRQEQEARMRDAT